MCYTTSKRISKKQQFFVIEMCIRDSFMTINIPIANTIVIIDIKNKFDFLSSFSKFSMFPSISSTASGGISIHC